MKELIEAVVEIQRELTVRRTVYPKLVLAGKLTQGEADRRLHAMRCALYYLETALADRHAAQPSTTE